MGDALPMPLNNSGMRLTTSRQFLLKLGEMISEPYPAWTAIGCTELAMPGGLVEIRVQAVIS